MSTPHKDIVELTEDVSASPLYSEDLAPVPVAKRTWNKWNLAAIWVGMAVCIPTYMLASMMITSGMSWTAALVIIGLANLIITVPMVLNGHAGVKYGIPFPVLGRASFGTNGIHGPSVIRAIVACGWFGIQTWIGGLAIYSLAKVGFSAMGVDLDVFTIGKFAVGQFVGFGIFWLINVYFIWKGTESIKWLETWSAPVLILMGIVLIGWGAGEAGGFGIVLEQSKQLATPTVQIKPTSTTQPATATLQLNPIQDLEGNIRSSAFQWIAFVGTDTTRSQWIPLAENQLPLDLNTKYDPSTVQYAARFRGEPGGETMITEFVPASIVSSEGNGGSKIWMYVLALTGMVGFWATMSLSIADITRYSNSQKEQVAGQFIGLPGTMVLYSFVGIFVTCAAVANFEEILVSNQAPWDPVSLLDHFKSPVVVIIAQLFMLVATLSTNIAANVIAPANAFSNLFPKNLSFRGGGIVTAIIGILICPWWLMNDIMGILIFISGLLGPVLGILLADYFIVRKMTLNIAELYKTDGEYAYGGCGFNTKALIALLAGVGVALVGYWVPALSFLYSLSWFTGFGVAFFLYWLLMGSTQKEKPH